MCGQARHRSRERTTTTTVPADDVRASDRERERVVSDLRTHAADGRLTVEELEARVDRALSATTRRDLASLTGDLPRARRPRDAGRRSDGVSEHFRTYVGVMALLVVIWALTGAGYPWFVWPALGWGIGLVSHLGACAPARRRSHRYV